MIGIVVPAPTRLVRLLLGVAFLLFASAASAQDPADIRYRWNVEFGVGWDNSLSGNINSSAIGVLNGQNAAILANSYEDVYGTGLHLRIGGGYLLDEVTELRAVVTFQNLGAELAVMGDLGTSRLYGQYDDYESLSLDVGLRVYANEIDREFRPYVEGAAGLAFINETDVVLVAPSVNLAGTATDFYDRTAAFALSGSAGVLWQVAERVGIFGQFGLRWMTGMSEVDNLEGTGLESINDNSSRWTLPILFGVRARF